MAFERACLAACAALLVTGCGLVRDQTDPNTVSVRGVQPTLEQLNVTGYSGLQDQLVWDMEKKAGFEANSLGPGDQRWTIVFDQGVYEVSRQCDQYLDALFRFNREQRATRQGLTAAAATTGVVLGLSGVTTTAMAIVAAAFGLSATLFDAAVNTVLFTIEPSALRNIVLKGRQSYLDNLVETKAVINSRPRMLMALQGYLAQCSPAAIEANINNAAHGTDSVAATDRVTAQKAATLAAPSLTLMRASTIVASSPAAPPPPPSGPVLASGRHPPEEANVTVSMLQGVQQKLGVTGESGFFGPKTRTAIAELQNGLNRRDPGKFAATDVNGYVGTNTALVLAGMPPMKAPFQTPFERAMLGVQDDYASLDPLRVNFIVDLLEVPADQLATATTADDKMALVRNRIVDLRKTTGLTGAAVLDSQLYDKLWSTSPLNPKRTQ
jgi:hypothetical protein